MADKAANIISIKVAGSRKEILNLDAAIWQKANPATFNLSPTPLANQPSEYIKANWDEKEFGKITKITVKSIHNGKEIFFYLVYSREFRKGPGHNPGLHHFLAPEHGHRPVPSLPPNV